MAHRPSRQPPPAANLAQIHQALPPPHSATPPRGRDPLRARPLRARPVVRQVSPKSALPTISRSVIMTCYACIQHLSISIVHITCSTGVVMSYLTDEISSQPEGWSR